MGLFDRLQSEINAQEKAAGLSMADVLSLPDDLRNISNWLMRKREANLNEVAAHTGKDLETTRSMLAELTEKGFVRELNFKDEPPRYRMRLAAKRGRQLSGNIWANLDDKVVADEAEEEES